MILFEREGLAAIALHHMRTLAQTSVVTRGVRHLDVIVVHGKAEGICLDAVPHHRRSHGGVHQKCQLPGLELYSCENDNGKTFKVLRDRECAGMATHAWVKTLNYRAASRLKSCTENSLGWLVEG